MPRFLLTCTFLSIRDGPLISRSRRSTPDSRSSRREKAPSWPLATYCRTEKWSLLTSAATGIAWNLFRSSDAWLGGGLLDVATPAASRLGSRPIHPHRFRAGSHCSPSPPFGIPTRTSLASRIWAARAGPAQKRPGLASPHTTLGSSHLFPRTVTWYQPFLKFTRRDRAIFPRVPPPGSFVILYCGMRRWDPAFFSVVLQGFFWKKIRSWLMISRVKSALWSPRRRDSN